MTSKPGHRAASLTSYLRGQAGWRLEKFEEWGDPRSQRAAEAISALADYVETLPEDDPRLASLAAANCLLDDVASLDEEAGRMVSRYGHDGPPEDPDTFLSYVTDVAIDEAAESIAEHERDADDPLNDVLDEDDADEPDPSS